ncbi:hypothetical protein M5X11_33130 [Paenibacillus alginolyticus]|uniref:DUF6908 domain-containing protein n=1 Tax=Paenibacillus alginolyticus TaxID=59839 RepID=UPI000409C1D2|nr:hypothetical protein [Paenibacillus alginolyticus]MCY9669703.1 hypothetical protein [Paenibacillus alginolyticus]
MIYQKNFNLLNEILENKLLEFSKSDGNLILRSEPFMDLIIENLVPNVISMTHYFELNGDLIAGPDMEIRIDPELAMIGIMSFKTMMINVKPT